MKAAFTRPGHAAQAGSCNFCRAEIGADGQLVQRTDPVLVVEIRLSAQAGYEFRICAKHAREYQGDFMRMGENIADFGSDG